MNHSRFQRAETRSSRLPIDNKFERFGTVSVQTYRQALSGLSWLSSSPSGVLRPIAEPGQGPVAYVAAHELPTPAQVERSSLGHSPDGPNPLGGFAPTWRVTARNVGCPTRRVCPRRPDSNRLRGHPSDRTPGLDLAEGPPSQRTRICSDEPPSNRTSTSRRIRLYGNTPLRLMKSAPLDR